MKSAETDNWLDANQNYLAAALAVLRCQLEKHLADGDVAAEAKLAEAQNILQQSRLTMSGPPALETLSATFGLSSFETDILLLCAAVELDSKFASLYATINGDPLRASPTLSLALAALPNPHWSALMPAAPLRYWRLLEVNAGSVLTLSPLRIDERILHYLTGVQHLDERLAGIIAPLRMANDLVPSHRALAERVATLWSQSSPAAHLPIVQLCGDEIAAKRDLAVAACAALGMSLGVISVHTIPTHATELESLIRLWEREAALSASALLVECDKGEATEASRSFAVMRLLERTRGAVMVATRDRLQNLQRLMITLEVHKPSRREQCALWESALGTTAFALNGKLETLVSQFSLSAPAIHAVCAETTGNVNEMDSRRVGALPLSHSPALPLDGLLWEACRVQARPHLDDLAQRIEPVAAWEDLVLPPAQKQILRAIAVHVRQRTKVYETWGFAAKSARGLGISALFAGASGTGKTMAAEVLANELRLDLYRIDLSQVVSKYIGETEKNLRRVFDAAEEGGAILLFDEADALFGKRSEVKDSHDRYANIEISYLLQRMEAYRGLAILTTNMKDALDQAFLRRIRFVAQFPFPDAAQRREIWRRIFPANTPAENLDANQLARLNVTGGNIRNIALQSAFLAADADEPVCMKHLLQAARSEYAKLDRPLTETEIGGWGAEGMAQRA